MTQLSLQRYLRTLNQCKWLGLASFAACVGVAGAIAFKPGQPPLYKAEGALIYNVSPVTLSQTATKIQEQGKNLTKETLLDEGVIKAAAAQVKVDPQQVAKNVTVQLPQPGEAQIIQVFYVDTEQKRAASTLQALMNQISQHNQMTQQGQVHAILELFQQQLPQQIMQAREAEQHLEDYERLADKENSPQRANQRVLLEQKLKLRQEQLYKSQLALEDARLAAAVQTANLTIVKPSLVKAVSASDKTIMQTLGIGVLGGLGISAGLIPLLGLIAPQPTQSELRRKLLAAYQGRCAITGCAIQEVLEAVAIQPNKRSHQLSNWLILRSDIKELFNTHRITIEPVTRTVLIDPSLGDTSYGELVGKSVYFPDDEASQPNIDALRWHFRFLTGGWTE